MTRVASAQEHLFDPRTGKDLPPNPRRRLKVLPEAKRIDVLDPMTGFIAGRDLIRKSWLAGTPATGFRLPIYDGRHRYDVVLSRGAVRDEKVGNVVHRVVPVTARVEPAGGFEGDMAKHTREGRAGSCSARTTASFR